MNSPRERARAMRDYNRRMMSLMDCQQQAVRRLVYRMRAAAVPEPIIGDCVDQLLKRMRPWLIPSAQLVTGLEEIYSSRRRLAKQHAKRRAERAKWWPRPLADLLADTSQARTL